ncbi:DUF4113 domain-containing protein [Acinetobacter baumannii]|uniref:Y-family DNA polymerase n=1 Tax=Acinetobacter baumannii TaxID=470 RepID=UPI0036F4A56D
MIDINNAYCSFERVFNPKLNDRAVIVTSNGDGCIVARSAEAKALNIPMGAPLFKVIDIVKRHNVIVLSSNYALYGEMSRRFHNILRDYVTYEEHEEYSIDEAWIDLTSYVQNYDLNNIAKEILQRLKQWLGVPCCIGIGKSKTEAKISNHIAKKNPQFKGICNLVDMDPCDIEELYSGIDVSEVWGVGRKYSKRLNEIGIFTVFDLACANPFEMKNKFGVVMQRTILELQGQACIPLEPKPPAKKQIISSRSFGQKINNLQDLKEAATLFTQNAVRRLRADEQLCGEITGFVQSNPFSKTEKYYSKAVVYRFPEPTDCVLDIVKISTALMNQAYMPNINFKKCGVVLSNLEPKNKHIYDLLTDMQNIEKKEKFMKSYELIQSKFGKKKLAVGACNLPGRNWSMKQERLSNNPFTWSGLLKVN